MPVPPVCQARRRAFITKNRTIILFTNTTLNRFGFGEHLQDIFISETINETEAIKKKTYQLLSTISRLDTRKSAILLNTRKKAHERTWRWCHSPLKNFWGGQIGVPRFIQDFPPLNHRSASSELSKATSEEGRRESRGGEEISIFSFPSLPTRALLAHYHLPFALSCSLPIALCAKK